MRTTPVLLLATLAVAGCGKKLVNPPPEQTVKLGEKKAVWRDWAKVSPCDVDPRRLKGEVEAMNAVLTFFLASTSARMQGVWADEHIAVLEQAQKDLAPALASHQAVLAAGPKCRFDAKSGLAEPLKEGEELAQQAKERLAEAPELYAYATAQRDLAKWKEAQPAAQDTAKGEWCPPKPKPGAVADVYYAFEDEKGTTEWLFCDGHKVTASPGGKPELVVAEPKPKKAPQPKGYLDAAAKYPANEVQRAPKIPVRKPPPNEKEVGPEPAES